MIEKPTRTSPVDWSETHRRLERARAALEEGVMPSPEKRNAILKARARDLARELEPEGIQQDRIEVIEFLLAYETYAIESSFVHEVYPLRELTPIPGVPAFVLGIINVRGRIVSVVDLKKFFDLPEKGLTDLNKAILISDGKMEFGLLADAAPVTRHVPLQDIQPSLPTLTGLRAEFLRGIASDRVTVLDAARLLADERMLIRQVVET